LASRFFSQRGASAWGNSSLISNSKRSMSVVRGAAAGPHPAPLLMDRLRREANFRARCRFHNVDPDPYPEKTFFGLLRWWFSSGRRGGDFVQVPDSVPSLLLRGLTRGGGAGGGCRRGPGGGELFRGEATECWPEWPSRTFAVEGTAPGSCEAAGRVDPRWPTGSSVFAMPFALSGVDGVDGPGPALMGAGGRDGACAPKAGSPLKNRSDGGERSMRCRGQRGR